MLLKFNVNVTYYFTISILFLRATNYKPYTVSLNSPLSVLFNSLFPYQCHSNINDITVCFTLTNKSRYASSAGVLGHT